MHDHALKIQETGTMRKVGSRTVRQMAGLAFLLPLMTGCLNPDFVNRMTGNLYPIAPGDTPFLAVRVINDTEATLEIPIVYDTGLTPTFTYLVRELTPEARDTGLLLAWPVLRVSVGDLDNPYNPLVVANFPDGGTAGVYPGRAALEAGVDFNRGDTVVFHFSTDSRSPMYIRVNAGIIEADAQSGWFTRADPYQRLRAMLTALGF